MPSELSWKLLFSLKGPLSQKLSPQYFIKLRLLIIALVPASHTIFYYIFIQCFFLSHLDASHQLPLCLLQFVLLIHQVDQSKSSVSKRLSGHCVGFGFTNTLLLSFYFQWNAINFAKTNSWCFLSGGKEIYFLFAHQLP